MSQDSPQPPNEATNAGNSEASAVAGTTSTIDPVVHPDPFQGHTPRRWQVALQAAGLRTTTAWSWLAGVVTMLLFASGVVILMDLLDAVCRSWLGESFHDFRRSQGLGVQLGVGALLLLLVAPLLIMIERALVRRIDAHAVRETELMLVNHLCVSCRHPLMPPDADLPSPHPDVRCPECGHEQPYD